MAVQCASTAGRLWSRRPSAAHEAFCRNNSCICPRHPADRHMRAHSACSAPSASCCAADTSRTRAALRSSAVFCAAFCSATARARNSLIVSSEGPTLKWPHRKSSAEFRYGSLYLYSGAGLAAFGVAAATRSSRVPRRFASPILSSQVLKACYALAALQELQLPVEVHEG